MVLAGAMVCSAGLTELLVVVVSDVILQATSRSKSRQCPRPPL
jgi:hypothetical protein